MIDFSKFNSVISVINYFHSEDACKEALAKARWGVDEQGKYLDVECPYCHQHHCVRRTDGRFRCKDCRRNFSVLVGTIFENTKLPLQKWFVAMYEVSSHKKGISSWQLGRDLGIRQASAWYMLQKIRSLFAQDDSVALEGEVECDEQFFGGKVMYKHDGKKEQHAQGGAFKQPIFGMIERKGRVVAMKVDNTKKDTLLPIIGQFVSDDAHLFTDEKKSYNKVFEELGIQHKSVNHSKKQWKDGDAYTNSIDGFWSHFNRMVIGIYHHLSTAYLQRYIDEECFRWNTRKEKEGKRFALMFNACVGKFTYQDVISLSTVIPFHKEIKERRNNNCVAVG